MAEIYAVQNGNWSDASTWSSGSVPTADDDVFCNGKTISIPEYIKAKSITNKAKDAILAGGFVKSITSTTRTINSNLKSDTTFIVD